MFNMKIGIFIEPPKKNFAYLIKWKKILRKYLVIKNIFLIHYTTIAVFDIKKNRKNFYLSLKKEMRLFNKFKIYITKPSIFHNDPLYRRRYTFFSK